MHSFTLSIVTPEREYFSGDVHSATIPGDSGEFGVLPGHAPFVSRLRPGVIAAELPGGGMKRVAILGGIAEVTPERTVVLADTLRLLDDVSPEEARAELASARAAYESARDDATRARIETRLMLAEAIAGAIGH